MQADAFAEDAVPAGTGNAALALADSAYEQGQYSSASRLYEQAYGEYTAAENISAALEARNWYILGNYSYSLAPHLMLNTAGIPESTYMLSTGFGYCGIQSMYFSALCRSLGIPARAIGGYQLLPGVEGTHFWAEFYVPEYDWVPVDVTIAEASEWSFNATNSEREVFKDYYFGNLDPYRFVIQKDVDIPLDPDPGDAVLFTTVHQKPAAVCDTCTEDMELGGRGPLEDGIQAGMRDFFLSIHL